ncbi:hypothetical protein [Agrobacterium tumefaciens]|uniref:hypothetical protein n=1 Tax=Agrobacterium tumefaciens TaxID=358 RepID=UPI00220AC486|nr:hypothetical protein [Agrobacterium tumefaciens]UXT00401.1 hypothetical protein FY143_26815 [Agrobacterium tumefaciens]
MVKYRFLNGYSRKPSGNAFAERHIRLPGVDEHNGETHAGQMVRCFDQSVQMTMIATAEESGYRSDIFKRSR